MVSRRQFILTGASASGAVLVTGACSRGAGEDAYQAAAREMRRPLAGGMAGSAQLGRELVRYATLAPSSHNTQCWKFRLGDQAIDVLPDFARRCPAVDPDDHHLYVSLGCATENLVQAALARGLHAEAHLDAAGDVIRVVLTPTKSVASPLFEAIAIRQCTRAEYDGTALSNVELKSLEQAGTGNGVRLVLLTEKPAMESVLDYVVQGNTAQLNDRAFVAELKQWIRFNHHEALRSGDGLFSGATGNPAVPRWLGSLLFGMLLTPKGENDKYVRQVRSSAGIAVFVSEANDKTHWIETGRCYQRFALQAEAMGVRNAMLNQPVEVAALRPQFAGFLGIGERRPDLVVRFGRGPALPWSLRRPVDAVLV